MRVWEPIHKWRIEPGIAVEAPLFFQDRNDPRARASWRQTQGYDFGLRGISRACGRKTVASRDAFAGAFLSDGSSVFAAALSDNGGADSLSRSITPRIARGDKERARHPVLLYVAKAYVSGAGGGQLSVSSV